MSSTISARECPICLETLRDTVVTPCGHLTCEPCIKKHIRVSPGSYQSTCPTCRAPFPTVQADLSVIPKKYHVFISPPLRRVYFGDDGRQEVLDGLNSELATLKARTAILKCENAVLLESFLTARCTISRLTSDGRVARLALDEAEEKARIALDRANEEARLAVEAKEDARLASENVEKLRAECDALRKSQCMDSSPAATVERTNDLAALDTPSSTTTSSEPSQSTSPSLNGDPISPLPKRASLQSIASRADHEFCFSVVGESQELLLLPLPSSPAASGSATPTKRSTLTTARSTPHRPKHRVATTSSAAAVSSVTSEPRTKTLPSGLVLRLPPTSFRFGFGDD